MPKITIDFERSPFGPAVSGIVSHSEEEREIWVFRYDERSHSLKPRAYRIEARETTRHRWKIVKAWGRDLGRSMYRLEACPPVPPDVLSLVMAGFIEELKIEGAPNASS